MIVPVTCVDWSFPLAPPDAISAPSKASAGHLDGRSEILSLLDRRTFLAVCVAMHSSAESGVLRLSAREFVRVIQLIDGRDENGKLFDKNIEFGLFRNEYSVKRSELFFTSVLASKLGTLIQEVGGRPACWLHQVPDRSDGKIDVCLYAECDKLTWAPICLLEFGLKCSSKDKQYQTLAYDVNLSPQLLDGHVCLAVEVILSPTDISNLSPVNGWMRLSGVRLAQGKKVGVVQLWEGPLNVESVCRLFASIEIVANANLNQSERMWRQVKNSCIEDDFVWKVYDYRSRKVVESNRRSPEFSVRFIPGCEVKCQAADLAVIRYPRVLGSHTPRLVGQWISVIKSVQLFHDEEIVHGDLRASNIVFDANGEGATIIDFDFAGANGKKRYPDGFNVSINDGARHRSASEGRPLLFTHDWFAVGAMMGMCVLEANDSKWQEALQLLQGADVTKADVKKALVLLDTCKTIRVESLKGTTEDASGTGSPERKK